MKTDPTTEASIAIDMAGGMSLRKAAAKHGVAASTVARIRKQAIGPSEPKAPDIEAIVERVLRRISGNPAGKPEVVEAPSAQYEVTPKSRVVDLSQKHFRRIAYLSDVHIPFQDNAALGVACRVIRDYKPDAVIVAGDLYDCYSISDHDREPGRCDTLQDEFDAGKPAVAEIDDAAGDAAVLFVKGNHEERIDRMQRRNPGWFKLRSMELHIAADLPKRWSFFGNQTRFRVGPLTMLHGDLRNRGTASKHAACGMLSKLRTSCMFGHLHRFQSFFETGDDGTIRAGFANGHLCDVGQATYITNPDWQQGISLIDFDWSAGIFNVTPQLFVRRSTMWRGKTYSSVV